MTTPQLHTVAEAAALLRVTPTWLSRQATASAVPCTYLGRKRLFSDDHIRQIAAMGERKPDTPTPIRRKSA